MSVFFPAASAPPVTDPLAEPQPHRMARHPAARASASQVRHRCFVALLGSAYSAVKLTAQSTVTAQSRQLSCLNVDDALALQRLR